ncbi:hypothetical protein ACLOJK_006822, partial [Asimina triloba]
ENRTACGLWDPVAGRAPSRCLRAATVAPPAAVPAKGRYKYFLGPSPWLLWDVLRDLFHLFIEQVPTGIK